MEKLLTQREVCELLRISYPTLNRKMNAGDFVPAVNGRGKKLLFDPDTVRSWIKSQQQIAPTSASPNVSNPAHQKREEIAYRDRQKAAQKVLARHGINGV